MVSTAGVATTSGGGRRRPDRDAGAVRFLQACLLLPEAAIRSLHVGLARTSLDLAKRLNSTSHCSKRMLCWSRREVKPEFSAEPGQLAGAKEPCQGRAHRWSRRRVVL